MWMAGSSPAMTANGQIRVAPKRKYPQALTTLR
jgi:hypothetical protein